MRYSSSIVLGTLAVGSVAAVHNRHASFHARRQVEAKRDMADVDWSKVAYDLSNVDWKSVFPDQPAATPAAAAAAVPADTPAPAAAPASTSAAAANPVAPANAQVDSVHTSSVSNLVSDIMNGVAEIALKLGAKVGKNSKTNNGGVWIGTDSQWQGQFVNKGSRQMVLYCWRASGFTGMSINANVPDISVGLKPGQHVDLSFAQGVPGACAPAFPDTTLAMSGGLFQTWWEFNYGPNQNGAFDVSKNTNMHGASISAVGSKCTSDMNQCVFQCNDPSVPSCWKAGEYKLTNCNAASGGGTGFDPVMNGPAGGCTMGGNGEKITITIS